MSKPRTFAAVLCLGLMLTACGGQPDVTSERVVASPAPATSTTPVPSRTPHGTPATTIGRATDDPSRTPRPAPTPDLADAKVTLTKVKEYTEPVVLTTRSGDNGMYVAEKGGRVKRLTTGAVVLDISSEVTNNGEQGLLGLTFSPNGDRMYVYFTNRQSDQVVREYDFTGRASNPRTILEMDDPYGNHNGGNILFGPDGFLYIGTGDGGSAGDPQNRAQNLNDLLGKMLRIDPSKRTGSLAYGIPDTNPFVGSDGRDEIWAFGLRNPWRYSFDRDTGALWIADVGQGDWEEVNVAPASSNGGENYGWRRMEGTHSYSGGSAPRNHHGPIYEYSHADGSCSVTGGYVYRGSKIAALRGSYVFADFCVGRLRAFATRNGTAINHRYLGPKVGSLSSFGQDKDGELYVLSLGGGVYRIDPA